MHAIVYLDFLEKYAGKLRESVKIRNEITYKER